MSQTTPDQGAALLPQFLILASIFISSEWNAAYYRSTRDNGPTAATLYFSGSAAQW